MIDTTPPAVVSIERADPDPTSASSVQFLVTFDEDVTGVDVTDFALALSGTATGQIASVSGSGSEYTITMDQISGEGTLGLDLVDDDTILDIALNKLGGTGLKNGNLEGQVYTIQ